MRSRLAAGLMIAGCVFACDRPRDVQFFVAASVSDLAMAWQDRAQTVPFEVHSGASLILARQISRGAHADLYLPAGWMALRPLEETGQIARIDSHFLENRLVVVSRPGLSPPETVESLTDARFERVALADPELAPAGSYARVGLVAAGLWAGLGDRRVLTADVRSCLVAVASGAADVGIVYETDARREPELEMRVLDDRFPVAHYPLVLLRGARPRADSLWNQLHGDAAREAAAGYGFR